MAKNRGTQGTTAGAMLPLAATTRCAAAALCAMLFGLPLHAQANDLLRLYGLAQQRDSVLQSAAYQRDAAVEVRPQALAQWLPQLDGSASSERERISDPASSFGITPSQSGALPPLGSIGLPGCELATEVTVRCNVNYTTYGLTLTQTVWSFQAYSQLREADSRAASAEATFLSAQQNLVIRVAQAYFAVLQAQDLLNTLTAERSAYATMLKQSQGRQQTGVGSASEVKQAQAYYDQTAQNVINAQNAVDNADLALGEIIGGAAGHIAGLRDDIPLTAPDPVSVDAWVSAAESDNPDVRAAQLSTEAARRDIGVQRGRGLPSLELTGTDAYVTAPSVLGGHHGIDTVGISFNWPLFQGGAVASAVRQSRALYHESQANLTTLQRQTEQQTRSAYLGIVSNIRGINAARRAIDSARAAVESAQRDIEFNVGGGEFALLGYQGIYYNAAYVYDQARYAYLSNVLLLKQQAGRLSERDLASIDALLVVSAEGLAPSGTPANGTPAADAPATGNGG
ncbi:MAG TPA: TolC family protein [Steroidobacteraceae bacterium]|jgi:outer membrane protein|nr:TolC family protein [Steroidobacteraceae bacterium]